jgi:hypothetical protein
VKAAVKQMDAVLKPRISSVGVLMSIHRLYTEKLNHSAIAMKVAQCDKRLRYECTRLPEFVADFSLEKEGLERVV